jgi:Protein of unknown function (DUF3182)
MSSGSAVTTHCGKKGWIMMAGTPQETGVRCWARSRSSTVMRNGQRVGPVVSPKELRDVVLPGYTVFSASDAQTAARRMLRRGAIRVKKPLGASGEGQTLVATIDELDAFLEQFAADEMATCGLVLEENLRQVTTVSVGHVAVDDNLTITYQEAKLYDQAMSEYPGFMASRRNYDVGQGIDADGRRRSGVFESSWRIGGASSAELVWRRSRRIPR